MANVQGEGRCATVLGIAFAALLCPEALGAAGVRPYSFTLKSSVLFLISRIHV